MWEIRRTAPISRLLRPRLYFSRSTSRILALSTTSAGPPSSSSLKDLSRGWKRWSPTSGHPAPLPTRSNPPLRRRIQVDEMRRNGWTASIGMSGRNESESVDDIRRNEWTKCVGISNDPAPVHDGRGDSAADLHQHAGIGRREEDVAGEQGRCGGAAGTEERLQPCALDHTPDSKGRPSSHESRSATLISRPRSTRSTGWCPSWATICPTGWPWVSCSRPAVPASIAPVDRPHPRRVSHRLRVARKYPILLLFSLMAAREEVGAEETCTELRTLRAAFEAHGS